MLEINGEAFSFSEAGWKAFMGKMFGFAPQEFDRFPAGTGLSHEAAIEALKNEGRVEVVLRGVEMRHGATLLPFWRRCSPS